MSENPGRVRVHRWLGKKLTNKISIKIAPGKPQKRRILEDFDCAGSGCSWMLWTVSWTSSGLVKRWDWRIQVVKRFFSGISEEKTPQFGKYSTDWRKQRNCWSPQAWMNLSGMYCEKQRNKSQYWACLQGQKTEYFIDFLEKKCTVQKKGTGKNILQPASSLIQFFFSIFKAAF